MVNYMRRILWVTAFYFQYLNNEMINMHKNVLNYSAYMNMIIVTSLLVVVNINSYFVKINFVIY